MQAQADHGESPYVGDRLLGDLTLKRVYLVFVKRIVIGRVKVSLAGVPKRRAVNICRGSTVGFT